jgi:isoleucyl-tRNA synthetase
MENDERYFDEETVSQTAIPAQKSTYEKCQRCWNYWPTVGDCAEHPDLCGRCVEVISG